MSCIDFKFPGIFQKKHCPVSLQWHMRLITYHLIRDHLKLESQYFSHCWIHIISSSLNKTKKHKAFLLTVFTVNMVTDHTCYTYENSVMRCKKQRLWWKLICRIMSDILLSNHSEVVKCHVELFSVLKHVCCEVNICIYF